MRCLKCGGVHIEKRGQLKIVDDYVGSYSTDSVHYYECGQCGDWLFPKETALAVEKKRNDIMDSLLQSRPLNSFLSASETAATLGISRQALHKHRRIRRGFIYHTEFSGKMVYLKDSVFRFKEIGDGRFPLCSTEQDVEYESKAQYADSFTSYVAPETLRLLVGDSLYGPVRQTQRRKMYHDQ